jgi:hypothetical protein
MMLVLDPMRCALAELVERNLDFVIVILRLSRR